MARKTATVVCSAATDAPAAPVAEAVVGEVKSGVAHLKFQRGSADKVRLAAEEFLGAFGTYHGHG